MLKSWRSGLVLYYMWLKQVLTADVPTSSTSVCMKPAADMYTAIWWMCITAVAAISAWIHQSDVMPYLHFIDSSQTCGRISSYSLLSCSSVVSWYLIFEFSHQLHVYILSYYVVMFKYCVCISWSRASTSDYITVMVKSLQTVYLWEVCQEYCAAGNLTNRYKHCYAVVLGYELQLRIAVAAAESISISHHPVGAQSPHAVGGGREGLWLSSTTCISGIPTLVKWAIVSVRAPSAAALTS